MTPLVPDDAMLEDLRLVGDEPADKLAQALLTAHGDDVDERFLVRSVLAQLARGETEIGDDVRTWFEQGPDLPAWADADEIACGQAFFRRVPLPIATALFCASLPNAYAAAHGAAVLTSGSHLVAQRRVARRIAETGQMLFDVMDFTEEAPGSLGPGTQGYMSARGVRLLHAVIRQALLSGDARPPWPAERGVPINQEDLLGTLCTFTVTVLHGLGRLGIPYTEAEGRGYMHAWNVVGFLLGIEESLLPLTIAQAEVLADRIRRRQHQASPEGRRLTAALLEEMRLAMPPGLQPMPVALVRHLVPAETADMLAVPPCPQRWQRVVAATCATGPHLRWAPGLRRLMMRPGGIVGRSMLRMFVDRTLHAVAAPYRLDVDALRQATGGGSTVRRKLRDQRRRRRGDDPRSVAP